MARIGVSITKSTSFRGATQEFSNVYFYDTSGLPDETQAEAFIDNLTSLEKTFHSTAVTFVRGRVWSQTGDKATSNMIKQKNLSGTGARTTMASLDPERAFLFRLRAGSDSRGNPVYLRKWYHPVGQFNTTVTIGNLHLSQTGGFTSTEKTNLVASMNAIGNGNGSPLSPVLVSKNGRVPTAGEVWSAHTWLEHHQLGDMWRAA